MRSNKKKNNPVEGPSPMKRRARASVAAVERPTRRPGKPGPRKETSAGPVKTASRKTHPKPPDGEC